MITDFKLHMLQDLIEDLKKVDAMVKLHSSNPSKFMLNQYLAKKEKLLSFLIDELIDSKVRSVESFRIISLALMRFYPEFSHPLLDRVGPTDSQVFKELEAALV